MNYRKNVSIRSLIMQVNKMNAESTCSKEVRQGWNGLLEDIMMDAKVYAGYGHLRADQVPADCLPGITGTSGNYQFPDDTRRFYYISGVLAPNHKMTANDYRLEQQTAGQKEPAA